MGSRVCRLDDEEMTMVGRWLCLVGIHRWERRTADAGTSGNPRYLACARCNKERYAAGPDQTRGMTGIGGM